MRYKVITFFVTAQRKLVTLPQIFIFWSKRYNFLVIRYKTLQKFVFFCNASNFLIFLRLYSLFSYFLTNVTRLQEKIKVITNFAVFCFMTVKTNEKSRSISAAFLLLKVGKFFLNLRG